MPATDRDPFDLGRFLAAQETDYTVALAELRAGRKRSHWIWYVFPQLRGLGRSEHSWFYGIGSLAEARAYLAHPVLGARLRESVQAMIALGDGDAEGVLGEVDALKWHSCLTLFAVADPAESCFALALRQYFAGKPDARTLAMLAAAPSSR